MRRFQMFPTLVAIGVIGAMCVSVNAAGDQEKRRSKETIVIPDELLMELQKLSRETFGEEAFRGLSREIGRIVAEVMREVGHFAIDQPLDRRLAHVFGQDKNWKFEQTDRQTKTLALGTSGSLELKNVAGNIVVKAGGGREATLEIVRVSKGATDADAKLGLQRVTADISMRDNHATVHARYAEERRPNYAVSVAYTVTAPAGTSILVQTITGDITISGIKGGASAHTTTGAVDIAQVSGLESAHTVTGKVVIRDSQGESLDVSTMSGPVQLTNVKARRLEVAAVTAPIKLHDISAGGAEVSAMSSDIEYSGPVTRGGRYEFQTHNGEIRLALSGGFDIEAETFQGKIETDPAFGLKPTGGNRPERISLGPRRPSLKGTVDGGGAFVEVTSFGGQIRILRKLK